MFHKTTRIPQFYEPPFFFNSARTEHNFKLGSHRAAAECGSGGPSCGQIPPLCLCLMIAGDGEQRVQHAARAGIQLLRGYIDAHLHTVHAVRLIAADCLTTTIRNKLGSRVQVFLPLWVL